MKVCHLAQLGFVSAAILITGCGGGNAEVGDSVRSATSSESDNDMVMAETALYEMAVDADAYEEMLPAEVGPVENGDQFDSIVENAFQRVTTQPLSTFSIDVDTASYSKIRQYLLQYNQSPRPAAVRIEELVNYFSYQYSGPGQDQPEPFATHAAVSQCPWNPDNRLLRVALKGREIETDVRPASNLVLLIDTSGSMKDANKLPLLQRGMRMLLTQLNENDRVAIVAYASAAGLVLDSTSASEKSKITGALDRLTAGGSTNGGQGLQLAYQIARDHFIPGGTNRVLLCTDGDFNVGMTSNDQMLSFIEEESAGGIDLTVLGFGMGNLNDSMLEQISGRGNGNYAFIDTENEAKKVLVEQLSSTLVTIAKDVKIQIEFNPLKVAAYRLIGYENRTLESEDFNDDKKDAGEIGAGHSVTAFYEIIPVGSKTLDQVPESDALRYQEPASASPAAETGELLTLKLRYKLPEESASQMVEHVVYDSGSAFEQADSEFQFAAAVASFGMLLRDSEYRGDWTFEDVKNVATSNLGSDRHGLRSEFIQIVDRAQSMQ
ncbi:MAG: VWA domain-containing protein [Planctomycetota bacterium]